MKILTAQEAQEECRQAASRGAHGCARGQVEMGMVDGKYCVTAYRIHNGKAWGQWRRVMIDK